jgi:predicted lipoprotein with Yx(FWY)xxD motif
MRTTSWAAVAAVGVIGLAGCGSDTDEPASAGSEPAGSEPAGGSSSGDAVLATADSPLGEIVVDDEGFTVYVFDRDTAGSGESACSGQCLQAWPPVVADSDTPAVEGVDGEVGTITRDDGTRQITLDGLPLYYYAPDAQAGDVTGQGVQDVWWVVAPDGAKITAAESSDPPPVPGY